MSMFGTSALPLRRNILLAPFTTMKIGGPASYFAEPENEEQLRKILDWARQERLSCFVLGNGSNVIFDDAGYEGLVLAMRRFRNDLLRVDLESCRATVSAGVSLARLVRFCQESGLAGAEFLAQIPGTVGGALVMNAGFSRHEGQLNAIGDLVEELRGLNRDGEVVTRGRPEMKFSYRHAEIGVMIVLEATLQLWRRSKDQIAREMKANLDFRKKRQSIKEPNAGSVFKNPPGPGPSAGFLIERAGLKGKRIGGVEICDQHANYFINKNGRATSADVVRLMNEVRKIIFDANGILLEPEIRVIPKN